MHLTAAEVGMARTVGDGGDGERGWNGFVRNIFAIYCVTVGSILFQ